MSPGDSPIENLATWHRLANRKDFAAFLDASSIDASDTDLLADMIRADVQHRLAKDLPVTLDQYIGVSAIASSAELLDTAIQTVVQAEIARGRDRRHAFDSLRRKYPQHLSAIQTAEALSSLLGSSEMDPPRQITLPSRLGPLMSDGEPRYELTHVLGRGTQAVVYRAVDRQLSEGDRLSWVALKLFTPAKRTPARLRQLLREANRARQIDHPSVLRIYDAGLTENGWAFIASPLVDGSSLAKLDGPVNAKDLRSRVRWIRDVARGVQAVHDAGIIHMDLKPSNILIDREHRPFVADLGLSVWSDENGKSADVEEGVGTLAFAAPEQWRRGEQILTRRADVYALGAIVYWTITGKSLHGQDRRRIEDALADAGSHRRLLDEALREIADERLREVVRRACSFAARDRHTSADSLADDLEAWASDESIAWMRTPLRMRFKLWRRRSPEQVVAAVIATLVCVLMPAYLISERSAQKLRLAEVKAEQEVIRATDRAKEAEERTRLARHLFNESASRKRKTELFPWEDWYVPSMMIQENTLGPFLTNELGVKPDFGQERIDLSRDRRSWFDPLSLPGMGYGVAEGLALLQREQYVEADRVLTATVRAYETRGFVDDDWVESYRVLRDAARVQAMYEVIEGAAQAGLPRPDFDPTEKQDILRRMWLAFSNVRGQRTVYHVAANSLVAMYCDLWINDPEKYSFVMEAAERISKDAWSRIAKEADAAEADKEFGGALQPRGSRK